MACPTWQIAPQRRLSLSEPNLHSKVRTGRKFDRQLPDSWSKVCAGRKFEVAAPYEKLGTSSSLAIRLPISRDAVAAGEGALSTWTWRGARS